MPIAHELMLFTSHIYIVRKLQPQLVDFCVESQMIYSFGKNFCVTMFYLSTLLNDTTLSLVSLSKKGLRGLK